ncbi:hypothetical protein SEA_ELESAR_29 [Arthrobacter phage Elesar]|uniref:Uncharacterized protein n=1 Tax=Arthrobacter phage Elesar TaxID=2510522 RepID=A0A411CQ85_9CAUD|nr:hypothetical protein QEO79_gp29 [Arthrobacter phage Elesar]QAY16081.1 hypothetical protein SEA_ELESAR_29 [Arthrobacter phage Elesar]
MAFPPGVTTCLVFKKAPVAFGGANAKVHLEITPSVRLIHTATGTPFADFMETVAPAEGAIAQLYLPHTSQPGFQDEAGNAVTNWSYQAKERYEKGSSTKHLPVRSFQIPEGQETLDLSLVPAGPAALPTSAPIAVVTSVNGETNAVNLDGQYARYAQLARTPEAIIAGTVTRDAAGAITSAAVVWPDGTPGTFTGTPSAAFPGALDSYAITYGDPLVRTYTQPAVTRDAAGAITNQPAISIS